MILQEEYFKNIFNTVREGILILDANMRVLSANRSFYNTFKVDSASTLGSLLFDLGNSQWNIPTLRILLEDILLKNNNVDDYEIELNFEGIGQKTMLLNACKVVEGENHRPIIFLAIEDITERKLAEEDLKKNELFRNKLLENLNEAQQLSMIGSWEWNLLTNQVWWSDETYRIFGVTQDFVPNFEANSKFIHPDDFEKYRISVEHSIQTNDPLDIDIRLVANNDLLKYCQAKGKILHDDSGQPVRFIGTIMDITERKQDEETLRIKEYHLIEAQRIGQIGNWEWDSTTDTIIWSDEYYHICGIDPKLPTPNYLNHLKAYTPESSAKLDGAVKKAMQNGEPYELDLEMADPASRTRWICARGEVKKDASDRIVGLRGTAQNITERKQAEEALRRANSYNRSLIEASLDPLVTIGEDGKITDVNAATEKVTGCLRVELIGTDFSDYFTEPDKAQTGYKQVFTEGFVLDYPLILRHRDGHLTDVLYNASIYRDDSGNVVGVFAAARDVTERKQAEEEKKKLEDQLRHAQKMEAVGTLAGGIAHDFNNILNIIIGYGAMVVGRLKDDSLSKEQLNEMLAAAERAANLTKRLLIFSRKQAMEVKQVNVNEIIFGMGKMLSRIISEDIAFTTELTSRILIVMADVGQMEQVLLNLVSNARDAMPKGGRLTISTGIKEMDEEYIEAYGYGKPGTYALISVADTGRGMDAETQTKIFEPFFTTKEVGKGTGLGLSIVYGIIKQHNGYVYVYSEAGKGTEFKIYLPLINEETEKGQEVEAVVPSKGGTETILLAEDDTSLRKLSSVILESMGYTVITAEDGEDAITKYKENSDNIKLVVLDMIMPKKNGQDTYAEIKKISPDIKVLFVSGYTMELLSRKEMLNNGMDFILKPVSPKDLMKKVREALDR